MMQAREIVVVRLCAATLGVSALLPTYAVGRRPYGAKAFVSRVAELESLTLVDSSWAWPAWLLIFSAILAVIGAVSPRRVLLVLATTAFIATGVASLLSWRMVSASDLVTPSSGLFVAVVAFVVGIASLASLRWHKITSELQGALRIGSAITKRVTFRVRRDYRVQ